MDFFHKDFIQKYFILEPNSIYNYSLNITNQVELDKSLSNFFSLKNNFNKKLDCINSNKNVDISFNELRTKNPKNAYNKFFWIFLMLEEIARRCYKGFGAYDNKYYIDIDFRYIYRSQYEPSNNFLLIDSEKANIILEAIHYSTKRSYYESDSKAIKNCNIILDYNFITFIISDYEREGPKYNLFNFCVKSISDIDFYNWTIKFLRIHSKVLQWFDKDNIQKLVSYYLTLLCSIDDEKKYLLWIGLSLIKPTLLTIYHYSDIDFLDNIPTFHSSNPTEYLKKYIKYKNKYLNLN